MAETILEIPVRAQEQTLWCWAAITSGISAVYSSTPLAPCKIAARVLTQDCCHEPLPCNREASLDEALGVVGLACTIREVDPNNGSISFQEVGESIVTRRLPIGARIRDKATGDAHFVLIIGCDPATEKIVCADSYGTVGFPAPRYRMPYATFLTKYGNWGVCTDLFFVR